MCSLTLRVSGHTGDLQHRSDAIAHGFIPRIGAEYGNPARIWRGQPEQHTYQRGLACAIGAKQGEQFPAAKVKIDVAQCGDAP